MAKGISLAVSPTCLALLPSSAPVVGSRVVKQAEFFAALLSALENYDTSRDRAPGQHFVVLPEVLFSSVSCGVGLRSGNVEDYVVRVHRGHASAYLMRSFALPVERLAVVVYTREAWQLDADVQNEGFVDAIGDHTHVVVAVLASAGPSAPADPRRLILGRNGGNNEYMKYSPAEFEAKLVESVAYWDKYAVVAD